MALYVRTANGTEDRFEKRYHNDARAPGSEAQWVAVNPKPEIKADGSLEIVGIGQQEPGDVVLGPDRVRVSGTMALYAKGTWTSWRQDAE